MSFSIRDLNDGNFLKNSGGGGEEEEEVINGHFMSSSRPAADAFNLF